MSLTAGIRLGHYDITLKIGEGGMGEVYQGRDTKLDWDVALKVCPRAGSNSGGYVNRGGLMLPIV